MNWSLMVCLNFLLIFLSRVHKTGPAASIRITPLWPLFSEFLMKGQTGEFDLGLMAKTVQLLPFLKHFNLLTWDLSMLLACSTLCIFPLSSSRSSFSLWSWAISDSCSPSRRAHSTSTCRTSAKGLENRASFYFTADKTESSEVQKQATTEGGCREGQQTSPGRKMKVWL